MVVDPQGKNHPRVYTVVLRCAESLMRIPTGRGIRIAPIISEHGDYEAKILTRTDQVNGIVTPLPRELWIEVTGPAPSIEIALGIAASIANQYVRQVAFGANAWQGLLTVHLAYESTPGQSERMFFQNWIRDETGLPRVARNVDPDLMFRLLVAITQLSEKDKPRVVRAITQYTDALQHWKIGNELYALAHLYMGVEAITPSAIRWEINRRGLKDRRELEVAVLDPPKLGLWLRIARWHYSRAGGYVPSPSLDSWARQQVIFCGDDETFKTAKEASDKLEHGLSQHDEVHRLALKCVEKCAAYLRSAILKFVPLTDEDRIALSSKPYANPVSTGGFERHLLATIVCNDGEIAAPDQAYPQVRWGFDLKDFKVADDGGHQMRVTQTITPVIGVNAQMKLSKIHFAGPTETTHTEIEVKVDQKKPDVPIAGVGFLIDDPASVNWVQPLGSFILNCNAVRHLGWFWIQRLTAVAGGRVSPRSIRECADHISGILVQDGVPDQLREDCKTAWDEALQLDEVRLLLAGCVTIPEGLMCIDEKADGKAPLITDIGKLREMNDRTVQIANKLRVLLDDLLRLPVFSKGVDGE